MSMLERLTIRGIRNFGVDAEDEQKIVFSAPLTLILGQNGSGKTTIIECIKYALTGELPPNCKNYVGFISNPDVLHTSESFGQVKLRLKNLRSIETTICRSAKVTKNARNKTDKQSGKGMDATITVNENGKEISRPTRLEDATNEMVVAIGVPKAIINHVLFCHQEESSWPLGTDSEVMKIFDEIFGTTEYNIALDKMRGMRKKYDTSLNEKKVNLKAMEMTKSAADQKTMEINKHRDEMEDFKANIEEIKGRLPPLDVEYKRLLKISEQLSSLTKTRTKTETELKNQQDNERALSAKIKEIFAGTEKELEAEIKSFKLRFQKKQDDLEDKELSAQVASEELQKISNDVTENDRKYHNLLQARQHEQDLYAEKAECIEKMCDALNIRVDFDIKNSNTRAAGLVENIQQEMEKVEEKIKQMNAENEKLDAEKEKEIIKHREDLIRLKSEIQSIVKQLSDSNSALTKQKEEIKKIERSAIELKDMQTKISNFRSTREQLSSRIDTQKMRTEIEQHRQEKQTANDELDDVDGQIVTVNEMTTQLAEINSKEKLIEKRKADVSRIKNKHWDSFQSLFKDEPIETGIKRKVESLNQKLTIQVNKLEAEIRLKEHNLQNTKNNHQNKKQLEKSLEVELRESEDKINRECDQQPFDEVLAATKENVERYQLAYSTDRSADVFYKTYIKKMEGQPCCPLCHKDLNRNEVDDLKTELSDKIDLLPTSIAESEANLMAEKLKLEKLLGMQSMVDRITKIRLTLLPEVQDETKKLEAELAAVQDKIKKTKTDLEEPKAKLSLIGPMIGDMSLLEDALRDIEQTQTDLEPLRRALPANHGPNDYDLDSLQKKRKEITERIRNLDSSITRKEKQCNEYEDQIRKLQEKEMELKQKELDLKGDIQRIDGLKARVIELNEEIKQLSERKRASDGSLIPIEAQIKKLENDRSYEKKLRTEKLNKEKNRFDKLKKECDNIGRLSKEITKLAEQNLVKEIDRFSKKLEELRKTQSEQTAQINSFQDEIKLLTKELAEQQNIERQLNDNRELMEIKKRIIEKENELETLRKNERDVDFMSIAQKKANVEQEINKLLLEKSNLEGQMAAKRDIIRKIEKELNEPQYRDAVLNYKKAYFEQLVVTKAIQDLVTYCETLEKALTKFHSDKMSKINTLIRGYWRKIYKGNDIDYIQINTDETKGTTKRRSYTYRVVASKNDTFMDFRGQSSAGQRVLACLIIRIALAETFSGHCGVLALDEPTTNLDRSNVDALCEALNEIVAERSAQSNFMLIVITHDEEFINALGRVEKYYRVCRNDEGKSRIEKLRVN